MPRSVGLVTIGFCLQAAFLTPASAEESRAVTTLPGVERGYRIVDEKALEPLPEGEPQTVPGTPGHHRVGQWDVTISGSVSFEIGHGVRRDGP